MNTSLRQWLIRAGQPLPVSLAVALLSAVALLAASGCIGDRYVRQVEMNTLQVLHDKTRAEFDGFRDSLLQDINTVAKLDLATCSPPTLEQLRQYRRSMLYVHELRFQPRHGSACLDSEPLPDLALQGYKHYRLPNGVILWWNITQLKTSLPSLVIITPQGVSLATSLAYLTDRLKMPNNYSALLVTPKGERLLALGDNRILSEEARQALQAPSALYLGQNQVYWRGEPGMMGIRLLVFTSRQAMDGAARRWHLAGGLLALFIATLLGYLTLIKLRDSQSLARKLQLALLRAELEVDYQPLLELSSGRCLGAEALVRWRLPSGERVPPDQFIPQAEANGLISAITQQVITMLGRDLSALLRRHPELYVSVNLAAEDIRNGHFIAHAERTLHQHGIAAQQLVYEITERSLVDAELACERLLVLRRAGHRIAIDDFGTGYSSLAYLQKLPVDVLKIDKCFVDALGAEAASSSVAPHIINMAHALGLKIIAEGVEHAAQAQELLALGAQVGQGWLFSKPLSAADFATFVTHNVQAHQPANTGG